MTLIVALTDRESIYMLADRRLSAPGRKPKEDGRKLMTLETSDGVAILGYAGLGATTGGVEPADWMSAVLRGRNMPLEQSLGELAGALQRQFPKHLARLPKTAVAAHKIIIPAFVGGETRLYSINLVFADDRKSYKFGYTRHISHPAPGVAPKTPRVAIAGSGSLCLKRDTRWMRGVLRLLRESDRKRIPPYVVADELARINQFAHQNTRDGSVGPRCIVLWRHKRQGVHEGGGASQFYDGIVRARDSESLPAIASGIDIQALIKVLSPFALQQLATLKTGARPDPLETEKMHAALTKLPGDPDEVLK